MSRLLLAVIIRQLLTFTPLLLLPLVLAKAAAYVAGTYGKIQRTNKLTFPEFAILTIFSLQRPIDTKKAVSSTYL
jgi:hypothetical protein